MTWTGPRQLARAITDPDRQARALAAWRRRRRGPVTWTGPELASRPRRRRAITDPDRQARALAELAEAAARAGDLDRARALAEQAEAAARAITDPDRQARALAELAEAAAGAGDLDRAEALARAITDPDGGRGRWPAWRRRRRAPVTWTGPGRWPGRPRRRPR